MGLVHARSFVYNGISSERFNLVLGYSQAPETFNTGLDVSLSQGESNTERTTPNLYGVTPTAQNLTAPIEIFKKDSSEFSIEESRAINNWLCQDGYKQLFFKDEKFGSNIVYNAIFTEIEDIVYNGINGKKLTFVCDSAYGYTMPVNRTYTVTGSQKITIVNTSDAGIYYPLFKIKTDDDVIITNETDNNKQMFISHNFNGYIDAERMMVYNVNKKIVPLSKLGWNFNLKTSSPTSIYWLRLMKGRNILNIKGDCEIQFTFSFPRKVGLV